MSKIVVQKGEDYCGYIPLAIFDNKNIYIGFKDKNEYINRIRGHKGKDFFKVLSDMGNEILPTEQYDDFSLYYQSDISTLYLENKIYDMKVESDENFDISKTVYFKDRENRFFTTTDHKCIIGSTNIAIKRRGEFSVYNFFGFYLMTNYMTPQFHYEKIVENMKEKRNVLSTTDISFVDLEQITKDEQHTVKNIDGVKIYHKRSLISEIYIHKFIKTYEEQAIIPSNTHVKNKIFETWKRRIVDNKEDLSIEQINVIYGIFTNNLSIVTGGPGRGKSRVLISIVNFIDEYLPKCKYIVLSPTHKANENLHRKYGPDGDLRTQTIAKFIKSSEYGNDIILIDESSMISSYNMYKLCSIIECSPVTPIVCFFGDHFQIPPINRGTPFKNIIEKKIISNIFELKKDFRLINIDNHGILKNDNPIAKFQNNFRSYLSGDKSDVVIEQVKDILEFLTIDNINDLVEKYMSYDINNTVVITYTNKNCNLINYEISRALWKNNHENLLEIYSEVVFKEFGNSREKYYNVKISPGSRGFILNITKNIIEILIYEDRNEDDIDNEVMGMYEDAPVKIIKLEYKDIDCLVSYKYNIGDNVVFWKTNIINGEIQYSNG